MEPERDFPELLQVVLDTTDTRELAEFYRRLLGLRYRPGDEEPGPEGDDWLVLRDAAGKNRLAFQQVPALADVPTDERRYQRLSLAWSISWLRIRAGEPWRDDFAEAVRPYAPFRVPPRFLVVHVIQQYALPIAYAGALLILWILGLLDVLFQA